MNRLTRIVTTGALLLLAGCSLFRSAPQDRVEPREIGVCSWSLRQSVAELDQTLQTLPVKKVHLALGPFIHPDGRHGNAEDQAAWKTIKANVASGRWQVVCTMIGTIGEDYSTLESIRKTGGIVPDQHWAANQKIVTQGARLTRELGCRQMSLHAGFLDENDPAAYSKFITRVRWIRDECARHGVTVLLESGQETAQDLARFLTALPGVYVNFDPANMILYGKGNPVDALPALVPWIRQVHIKDATPASTPGQWGTEVPWGDGAVHAKTFIARLRELGYKGDFIIEREGGTNRLGDITLAIERLIK